MRLGKHIAVVGAEIVGLAIALRLRREGFRVTLFDPEEPGSQTSSGNAGLIMTAHASALCQPGLWRQLPAMLANPAGPLAVRPGHLPRLMPWFGRFLANSRRDRYEAIVAALAPMVTRSLDAWVALLGQYESNRLFRQEGLVYAYKNRRNFLAGQKEAESRARFGIEAHILQPSELQQLEPALAEGRAGGVFYPYSGHCVDLVALSAAVVGAFRTSGGEVRRTKVNALVPGTGGITLVTSDGDIAMDQVVVAAGVWSGALVAKFGIKNVVTAERGYNLMLPDPGIGLQRPVVAGDDKFVITPMTAGIRLAGTAEFASVNAAPDWRRADILLPKAQALLPHLGGVEPVSRWMGPRPSTPDTLPLIGRTLRNSRVICAFGHSHLGLTLAAITAWQVADVIARRPFEVPAEALNPMRF